MSREKVKEIVDYMVSEGTQNTNYGCWAFDIPELCDKFDLPLEWFYEHNDDICRELDERDEVADYEQNYDLQKMRRYDVSGSVKKIVLR